MSRKSNGIPFILSPRPTKSADGKQRYYARLDPGRKLDIDFVDNECARCSKIGRSPIYIPTERYAEIANG